ncbi:hypothetical protein V6N13_056207 [Hibiscus sabdariffa]
MQCKLEHYDIMVSYHFIQGGTREKWNYVQNQKEYDNGRVRQKKTMADCKVSSHHMRDCTFTYIEVQIVSNKAEARKDFVLACSLHP